MKLLDQHQLRWAAMTQPKPLSVLRTDRSTPPNECRRARSRSSLEAKIATSNRLSKHAQGAVVDGARMILSVMRSSSFGKVVIGGPKSADQENGSSSQSKKAGLFASAANAKAASTSLSIVLPRDSGGSRSFGKKIASLVSNLGRASPPESLSQRKKTL